MAKPVVASRIGGVTELVVEEETALLVPPGDSTRLAQACIRVLADPALATSLGNAAYRRVVENYGIDLSVRRFIEVYSRVLDKHGTGRGGRLTGAQTRAVRSRSCPPDASCEAPSGKAGDRFHRRSRSSET